MALKGLTAGLMWLFFLSLITGCKTSRRTESAVEGVALTEEQTLTLGSLPEGGMRSLLYRAVEESLVPKNTVTESEEITTAAGDIDTFKFTVMRLTKQGIDISGDPIEKPDSLEVEITGWYKMTKKFRDDRKPTDSCASFDLHSTVVKGGDRWRLKDPLPLHFAREDLEDCY